jgi:hypothetical protein
VLASNALVFRMAALQTTIADLGARLDAARTDLEQALTIEVPLNRNEREEHEAELATAQARAALIRARYDGGHVLVTVRQIAGVLDVSVKTVNSWVRNGIPLRRPKLWAAGAWSVNEFGVRVMPLALLKSDLLTPIQRERLHVLRLCLRASSGLAHAA